MSDLKNLKQIVRDNLVWECREMDEFTEYIKGMGMDALGTLCVDLGLANFVGDEFGLIEAIEEKISKMITGPDEKVRLEILDIAKSLYHTLEAIENASEAQTKAYRIVIENARSFVKDEKGISCS